MNELPKTYHGKINKDISNNEKMFSTINNRKENDISENTVLVSNKKSYTVQQKIYNIFNSPNYIYKIDVTIVTDNKTYNKRIVGKTKTDLITIDGEYIPINIIRDIYIAR